MTPGTHRNGSCHAGAPHLQVTVPKQHPAYMQVVELPVRHQQSQHLPVRHQQSQHQPSGSPDMHPACCWMQSAWVLQHCPVHFSTQGILHAR
jgi:hypothetical protein